MLRRGTARMPNLTNGPTQSEDLLKVMLREPDELGDLDEKTWQVITDNAYQRFADELSYAATLQALTGHSPGNIEDDHYFEAWVNQTISVLAHYTNHRNR